MQSFVKLAFGGNLAGRFSVPYETRFFRFGDQLLPCYPLPFRFWRVYAILAIVLAAAYSVSGAAQKDSGKDSDQVYVAGGDVKPPKVIHYVEPAFSPSSQDAYVEGVVRIAAIVNLDGAPAELQVTKGLNEQEDKLAIEALKQWRFKPGTKNERPVRVKINVEINFHLL